MNIETLQFRKEDGTAVKIIIGVNESLGYINWCVRQVMYRESRKKTWKFFASGLREDTKFRKMTKVEQEEYKNELYEDFCGADRIRAAYEYAYEMIKPEVLKGVLR